jgi:hypothetical protein
MADFGFTLDDLDSSTSITRKIAEGFNPNGSESLTTSASQSGYENETMSTRDVSEILSR